MNVATSAAVTVAAATAAKSQAAIIETLKEAGATNPSAATAFTPKDKTEEAQLNALLKSRVVRQTGRGDYYFDRETHDFQQAAQRRVAAILVLILAVGAIVGLVVAVATGAFDG